MSETKFTWHELSGSIPATWQFVSPDVPYEVARISSPWFEQGPSGSIGITIIRHPHAGVNSVQDWVRSNIWFSPPRELQFRSEAFAGATASVVIPEENEGADIVAFVACGRNVFQFRVTNLDFASEIDSEMSLKKILDSFRWNCGE